MTQGFIDVANGRVAYTVTAGRGIPIVLLHGFCLDSRIWNDWQQLLGQQKVIRIDCSSFGKSKFLPDTIEEQATAVRSILEKLNTRTCIIIGHSMGGYIALAFAKMYGEMLAGLGMFHSHPYEDDDTKKESRAKGIQFIRQHGHTVYVKQLIPSFATPTFVADNSLLINELIHNAVQNPSAAFINSLEMMIKRPDQSEVLRQIACPVMFIIGEQDETIPQKNSLEQTHLPTIAIIHILPRVAHLAMLEAPKISAGITKDFIQFCTNR